MDLALVVNTTDKYSWIWDSWYHYFKKYWYHDQIPVYWLNEKKDISYPFKQIKVNIPEVKLWTKKLRESVKQIPENNLLTVLEDLFFTDSFRTSELEWIYDFHVKHANLIQIRHRTNAITLQPTFHKPNPCLKKIAPDSRYLIAHQHAIWRKDFLLECIKVDESPWDSEIKGSERIRGKDCKIYHYEKDWFVNVLRYGKPDPRYKDLIT